MVKVCYFAGVSPCFAHDFAGRNSSLSFARYTGHGPKGNEKSQIQGGSDLVCLVLSVAKYTVLQLGGLLKPQQQNKTSLACVHEGQHIQLYHSKWRQLSDAFHILGERPASAKV